MREAVLSLFLVTTCLAGQRKGANLNSNYSTAFYTKDTSLSPLHLPLDRPDPSSPYKYLQPWQKSSQNPLLSNVLSFPSTYFTYLVDPFLLISKALHNFALGFPSPKYPSLKHACFCCLHHPFCTSRFSHYSSCLE